MKYARYFILTMAICLSGCDDEIRFPNGYDHPCDAMMGRFDLLPTSLARIPFEGRQTAVFRDSLGNEETFIITKSTSEDDKQAILLSWPDMTRMYYCYESEPVRFTLQGENLNASFTIEYMAKVYATDPAMPEVTDRVYVSINSPDYPFTSINFTKTLDSRTFGGGIPNTYIDSFSCAEKTFLHVEYNSFPAHGDPRIFYNDTEGIVRFIDIAGRSWCFNRFE